MKSILVTVDHTQASRTAQALGIELAIRHNARLTGLSILDTAAIARPEPVPVGGMTYKVQRDQDLIKRERRQLDQSMALFGRQCREKGVEPQLLSREGCQLKGLEHEASRHDLVVMGRDTEFSPFTSDCVQISKTVSGILHDYPRPVIVTPPCLLCGESLLIIYDGRPGSERLLQILTMLGLPEGWRVQIMGLSHEGRTGMQHAQNAQAYLADHDVSANIVLAKRADDQACAILDAAQELKAKLVAFATGLHCGRRHLLHDSTDRRLLKRCSSALIVYR